MSTDGIADSQAIKILNSALIHHLSADRVSTYLEAVGFDETRALALYAWNMKISATFYPLLSAVEICLRNRIQPRMSDCFGIRWWVSEDLHALMGRKGKGTMLRAERAIGQRGHSATAGRMTAELSFGFWSNMLLPKYDRVLWNDISQWLPDLPSEKTRHDVYIRSEKVRELRNRISHHEPIFRRNLSQDYSDALALLSWLGPEKAAWIRPQLDTMAVLRERP